ncbi:hypothetical protein LCGC14_2999310, partial [marine sediment metagenome]
MKVFSILTALLVAAALYFLVLDRDAALQFAGNDAETVSDVQPQETPAETTKRVSVVALRSQARQIDSAVLLRGRTEAAREVDVRSETSGKIVSPPLRKGNFVEENQLLCELDPGVREAALAEAEARLIEARARGPEAQARIAEAEARLAEAEINDNAARKLSQGGYASQTRVVGAQAGVEAARAAVQAAKSGLDSAQS